MWLRKRCERKADDPPLDHHPDLSFLGAPSRRASPLIRILTLILNLFYQEPDPDRWLPFDRYPRRAIRRIVRGKRLPGGQEMVFINLVKGLKQLGVPFRVNDFSHARKHPDELVCIVGKPHVLFDREWKNPVLFGASVFSHPLVCPDLLDRYPVKRMLVPGEWMRDMCEPYYGDAVKAWPVGIDTDEWRPVDRKKDTDFLLYDKVRWDHDQYEHSLINPIKNELEERGLSYQVIRYGSYRPLDLVDALSRCRYAIFLCEHETQGLAYQQMLACGVPILAWDRGGFWQDPEFYPDRVKYEPVSSVPYWDDRCGRTFQGASDFSNALDEFMDDARSGGFSPREYILENLTLEKCAQEYLRHVEEVSSA